MSTFNGSVTRQGLVSIVIPAKDEADAIGATLRSLPLDTLKAAGFDTEVVLLDGNSTDRTREIAAEYGARILIDREEGKGCAVRDARAQLNGDFVIMLDADGTYAADAIPRVLSRLAWDDAEIVMGHRKVQAGAMSSLHRVGNVLLSVGASVLYNRPCPDLCTGLWGFRSSALRAMPLRARGFELEAELFAMASRLGLRVSHIPVDYLPRRGKTKLSSTRDGARIGWCLLRTRFAQVQPSVGPTEVPARKKAALEARH